MPVGEKKKKKKKIYIYIYIHTVYIYKTCRYVCVYIYFIRPRGSRDGAYDMRMGEVPRRL